MRASVDALFVRAAEALEGARAVRRQTQEIVDTARLERLQRELAEKIARIKRAVSRR